MPDFLKKEKKVEYIELIYDLVFVYLIGRNNTLIQHTENGFIDPSLYLTYVLCTLITIQVWYASTLFINRYGSNSIREYVGLFINMFLLFYMAAGTGEYWLQHFYRYNTAWMLILINLAVQYLLKYRQSRREAPWEGVNLRQNIRLLLLQAAIVAAGMIVYALTGIPATPAAMIVGLVFAVAGRKKADLMAVDFPHLTERIMLYIVFTFGEMIIAVSTYFTGGITPNNVYFAVMGFLIVVGLFMSYGFLYDHLIDRERDVSGNTYMIIHIFLIFSLSNLTAALEFMHDEAVPTVPKTLFLTASFVLYFLFLYMILPFTRGCGLGWKKFRVFFIILALYAVLMLVFLRLPHLNIAVSAALTFAVWFLEYDFYRKTGGQKA